MKVCILGDSGLLGQSLVQRIAGESENKVWGISPSAFAPTPFWSPLWGSYEHKVLNLLNEEKELESWLREWNPELLINCAGLVDLAECERSPQGAERLNAEIPEKLAQVAAERRIPLVHFSTDQVFDGKKQTPYEEGDRVNPISVYGRTKQLGEERVMQCQPKALIVRTNIVGFRDRSHGKPFAEWLCQALAEKEEITLFDDYVTSSMHVRDLSELILEAHRKGLSGIYHFATHDAASKFDFGKRLATRLGLDFLRVKRGQLKEANLVPKRPPYLALSVHKAEKALGKIFPNVGDTVEKLAQDFKVRFKEVGNARH